MHHLGVIIDIDHVYRPMSVTDEEDGVVVWLQHLQKVDICAAVEENKILELQHSKTQDYTLAAVTAADKPSTVHPSVI